MTSAGKGMTRVGVSTSLLTSAQCAGTELWEIVCASHMGTCQERGKFGLWVCEVILLEERGDVVDGVDAVAWSYARQEMVKTTERDAA